jgi:hypothetical protein
MPIFLITYTNTRTTDAVTHKTEWVCDSSYDSDRACEAFEKQFPTTAVVRLQELPPC